MTGFRFFYEGLPRGAPIPWGIWIVPLAFWCVFILALYHSMICLMVILRRQWAEKERLVYPLTQVPLEMIREPGTGQIVEPFFKNRVMWIGFAIPVFVTSVRALHNYFHFVPDIKLATSIPLFQNTTSLRVALSFPMVGFSYFLNLEVALGLWVFSLLARGQEAIFGILGIHSTEKLFYSAREPIMAHHGMGAMIALVLFELWVARTHLRAVLRKALTGDPDIDDSDEILSYRAAVFGLLGSLLVMGVWLYASGLPAWIVPLFLFAAMIVFLGITRIVVQGGVAAARAPLIAPCFTASAVGTHALGPAGLTTLGFTFIWGGDVRTFVMASAANGLKLSQEMAKPRRRLFAAMVIAIVVSIAASSWVVLKLAYTHGGVNLNPWFFKGGPLYPFRFISDQIE